MHRHPRLILAAILLSFVAAEATARTWVDSTGRYKIEGDFIKLDGDAVYLRRDDGKSVRIPLDGLSQPDQEHVRELTSPAADGPFAPAPELAAPAEGAAETDGTEDTHSVIAEGVGLTRDAALKDAFRAAVQQVVGTVVDAETLVKNDDLVRDQVLTYSDAYVPQHKIVSERQEGGLVRMKIQASVKRRSLVMKLKAANITVKDVDGQSMFGDIVTELQAEKDAAAMVRKALEGQPGFPLNCITAEVVGKPVVVKKRADDATISIKVAVRVESDAYDAFAKRLMNTLDGVAKRKGEFSLESKRWTEDEAGEYKQRSGFGVKGAAFGLDPVHQKTLGTTWNDVGRGEFAEIALAVNTTRDRSFERTEWKYYILDRSTLPVLAACATSVGEVKLSLLDGNGGVVTVARAVLCGKDHLNWSAISLLAFDEMSYEINFHSSQSYPEGSCLWQKGYRYIAEREGTRLGFLGPMFFTDSMTSYFPAIEHDFQIALSHEEIAAVKSAKAEVRYDVELPPTEDEVSAALSKRR